MRKAVKVLAGVVIVIVLLFAIAEYATRWFIGNQLRNDVQQDAASSHTQLDVAPEVSFGSSSVLLGLASGNLSQLTMTMPDSLRIDYPDGPNGAPLISGQPATTVEMHNVDFSDPDHPLAGSMTMDTQLSDDYLLATIQQQTSDLPTGEDFTSQVMTSLIRVSNVTSDPATGSLDIEFSSGAATLTMTPILTSGGMEFEISDAQLFGMNLPASATSIISEALRSGITQEASTSRNNITVDAFNVVEGGVHVQLSGQNVPLSDLSTAAEQGMSL